MINRVCLLLAAFLLISCDPFENYEVINLSNHRIGFHIKKDSVEGLKNDPGVYFRKSVLANDSTTVLVPGKKSLLSIIKNSYNQKFNLIVFPADSLLLYTEMNQFLMDTFSVLLSYNLQELERTGWQVVIPPDIFENEYMPGN